MKARPQGERRGDGTHRAHGARRPARKVVRVDAKNRVLGLEPERPGPEMPLRYPPGEA